MGDLRDCVATKMAKLPSVSCDRNCLVPREGAENGTGRS